MSSPTPFYPLLTRLHVYPFPYGLIYLLPSLTPSRILNRTLMIYMYLYITIVISTLYTLYTHTICGPNFITLCLYCISPQTETRGCSNLVKTYQSVSSWLSKQSCSSSHIHCLKIQYLTASRSHIAKKSGIISRPFLLYFTSWHRSASSGPRPVKTGIICLTIQ